LHVGQKNTNAVIDLNKIKIDFEFSSIRFKNSNKSEIKFEIKSILNFNLDAEKLNEKLYLIFRLYTAISV
jgi:hypothetical protein